MERGHKEREAKEGDTVNIDFTGVRDGKEFEGGSAKSFDLVLGSKRFVPGFEEQVIGHKAGDKFDIKLTRPENYPEPLTGKPVIFKVVLNLVKEKQVPAINDEFATKTNDVAGDGTTTATLLAQAIVHEGLKNVSAGANPMVMRKGMEKAVKTAVDTIKANSEAVKGSDDIARVGTVSSGDETIGKLIAEAMEKVSTSGILFF